MKKILAYVFTFLLSMPLIACAFKATFDGSRTGNESQLIMQYKILNTTTSQELELTEGDIVLFDIVSQAGSIDIFLQKSEEEPIYKEHDIPTSVFQVEITDSGTYIVSVTGKNAKGSINILKENKEELANTKNIDTITINDKVYYLISTESQLRTIESYGLDKNYMQQNDIELSDETWISIGTPDHPFTGSYNGNGFKITGLSDTPSVTPLFGNATHANLYNITFANPKIQNIDIEVESFVCKYPEECQIYDIFFEYYN